MWRKTPIHTQCTHDGLFVFYVTCNDISVTFIYMWRHRCAGGLKMLYMYLRSGSQRHRHFVGFFNVVVLHRHGTTLLIRLFREIAPFSRLKKFMKNPWIWYIHVFHDYGKIGEMQLLSWLYEFHEVYKLYTCAVYVCDVHCIKRREAGSW